MVETPSRKRAPAVVLAAVSALSAVVGCSLLVSTSDFTGGRGDPVDGAVEGSTANGEAGPLSDGGGVGGEAASDAAPIIAACDLAKPFGALIAFPAPINSSTSSEFAGTLSKDRRTLVFASSRATNGALYSATREVIGGTWTDPVLLANLDSSEKDTDPSLSSDDLEIYFDSHRVGPFGGVDLYMAKRKSAADPFSLPTAVPNVGSSGDDFEPWISASGTRLYFVSSRGTSVDIFVATRATTAGEFDNVIPIVELNAGGSEEDPIVTADELTVFFASDRPGGKGDMDVYVARRTSIAAGFSKPELVPELNSVKGDYVSWVAPDGCAIIIESYSAGTADLYYAERPP